MAHYCSECTYLDLETGDSSGKFWCDKKLERHLASDIECNRFCEAYSRSNSTSKSAYQYSLEHSSNSGCYLTTILCYILGMPDNNYFLNTMRNFRNNCLQKNKKYKQLLVEYDIVGPEIAKALNNDPLKKTIAIKFFNQYIISIVNLIEKNESEKAVTRYIEMTNSLKKLYSINNANTNIIYIESADIKESGHGIYKVKKITLM